MRHKAFSLVETLIALVVLSIALLGLATVPVATTRMLAHGVQRERALALAMAKIEEVEAVPLDGSRPPWVVVSGSDKGFAWGRTVQLSSQDMWTVAVHVAWDGPLGDGSLSLSRDYGPWSARR